MKQQTKDTGCIKKVKQFKKLQPGVFLVVACYVVCLVLALSWHTGQFLVNRILYAGGYFVTTTVQMEEFTPVQLLMLEDGRWATTGSDPQLILNNESLHVDTVRTDFRYTIEPLMETVFFTAPDNAYNLRQMVYANHTENGSVYWLPFAGAQSLRIDPDTRAGNVIQVEEIVLNEPRPFWAFYIPSGAEIAVLLFAPAFAAAFLHTIWPTGLWSKLKSKQKGVQTHE